MGVNGTPPTWRSQFGTRWWPVDQVEWRPPTQASPPHVDAWQPWLRLNRLKPWPAGRPLGPHGMGSSPLSPPP
jgi:hypothetical protein